VRTLRRTNPQNGTSDHVQIITSTALPIQAILQGFHGTFVMNIISSNKAYALFPHSTFISQNGVVLRKQDDVFQEIVQKYKKRNYCLSELRPKDPRRWTREIVDFRRPADCRTWTISFDGAGVECPKTPDFVLEHSGFGFRSCNKGPSCCTYRIRASKFSDHMFQHSYTIPDALWFFNAIKGKLERLERSHFIEARERLHLADYDDSIYDGTSPWEWFWESVMLETMPPDKYFDDEIPKWYAEWEQQTPPSARISMAPPDDE
ncbi:MAG: hypothetical protein Q9183_006138, partial [Haloplaca sp. 2 TL-2023]